MEIKAVEVLGAVLGFIPGVSTITGAIKACVYYKNTIKDEKKLKEANKNAKRIGSVSSDTLMTPKLNIVRAEKALWKASVLEMIPGVNIIVALYSTKCLINLNNAREADNKPNDYLVEKYDLKEQKNDQNFLEALRLIDNINTPYWGLEATRKDIAEGLKNWILENKGTQTNGGAMLKDFIQNKLRVIESEITKLNTKINSLRNKIAITPEVERPDRNSKLQDMELFLYKYTSLKGLYTSLQKQIS